MTFLLFLFPLLLCCSRWTFSLIVGGEENNIQELMRTYIMQHSKVLNFDARSNYSGSKFVVGQYHCPGQIGNRIFDFLNSFAIAVITNRTLVWEFLTSEFDDSNLKNCDEFLERKVWIQSLHDIQSIFTNERVQQFIPNRLSMEKQAQQLACTRIDENPALILYPGVHERLEASIMWRQGSRLGPDAKARGSTLFSKGSLHGYGILFQAAFEFSPMIRQLNDKLFEDPFRIKSWSKPIIIALHLRHLQEGDHVDVNIDLNCIAHVLDNSILRQAIYGKDFEKVPRECVVLIASDRPLAKIVFSKAITEKLGCVVIARSSSNNSHHGKGLHGPEGDGVSSMADFELLSRAHIIFGTTWSTFSSLIASIITVKSTVVLTQGKNANMSVVDEKCINGAHDPSSLNVTIGDMILNKGCMKCTDLAYFETEHMIPAYHSYYRNGIWNC